jgi:hypothetical protein
MPKHFAENTSPASPEGFQNILFLSLLFYFVVLPRGAASAERFGSSDLQGEAGSVGPEFMSEPTVTVNDVPRNLPDSGRHSPNFSKKGMFKLS